MPAWRERLGLGVAVAVLVLVPLAPAAIDTGSALGLLRLPVESIMVLLLLALIPWRSLRVAVAILFGAFVVVALLLAGIDRGYRAALSIRFDPLDWPQLGDAFGVAAATIGAASATALLGVIVLTALATVAALAWAALRVDAAVRARPRGRTALAGVAAAWVVAALVVSPTRESAPVAAAASVDSIGSSVARASAALRARAAFARDLADDRFADVPATDLLTALRGKDVVIAFVESYGEVALDDPGVTRVLRDGEASLAADGWTAQSAWLTSPTFGGLSWLAHSTLHTGVWIDRQALYSEAIRSDRLTLSAAFGRAGWRTVSVIPSNTEPWPFGTSFYHYDTLLDATNVGYEGPRFGYARIPDQYTLKHFADTELAGAHGPVMAEIDLVSSHTPWTPLPELVPWDRIGDGSVYDGQLTRAKEAAAGGTPKQFYGASVQYALGSLFSFLENVDDPNLVVLALGDHQPGAVVSGPDAGHDVPISVIAQDPAVFSSMSSWEWPAGLRPGERSPVWRMDAFRDRFLEAFGPEG